MAEANMDREWRVVEEFPDYEVSDQGVVRRLVGHPFYKNKCPAGQIVPQWRTKPTKAMRDGRHKDNTRMMATLSQEGIKKNLLVARLVCRAFHGEPPTYVHQAAHKNGNQVDDRSQNLRWATPKENHQDRFLHGTVLVGQYHCMSKISDNDVLNLRNEALSGATDKHLAKKYCISKRHVMHLRLGLERQGAGHEKIYVREPKRLAADERVQGG